MNRAIVVVIAGFLWTEANAVQQNIDWKMGMSEAETMQTVELNTDVVFAWGGMDMSHDVWLFPNQDAFDACDFSAAEQLATDENNPFTYEASSAGMFYFGCKVGEDGAHCNSPQKLALTVTPAATAQQNIDWKMGMSEAETMQTVELNTDVVFAWGGMDMSHDVWLFPNQDAFDACDFSAAEQLATDESNPFTYAASSAGMFYFGCKVGEDGAHCNSPQKLALTVTPAATGDSNPATDTTAPGEDADSTSRQDACVYTLILCTSAMLFV